MVRTAEIPGLEGRYTADDAGNVYGPRGQLKLGPHKPRSVRTAPGRGHLAFSYWERGSMHRMYVHRAVYSAFCGEIPRGQVVRHVDGDETNNRLGNLVLGTNADNRADSVRAGTHAHGVRTAGAKLTDEAVRAIRSRYAQGGVTQETLAAEFGVDRSQISMVVNRRTWRHVT
jgi:hypothetical protein